MPFSATMLIVETTEEAFKSLLSRGVNDDMKHLFERGLNFNDFTILTSLYFRVIGLLCNKVGFDMETCSYDNVLIIYTEILLCKESSLTSTNIRVLLVHIMATVFHPESRSRCVTTIIIGTLVG